MTANPKNKPLRDKKYIKSFTIEGEHHCILTGAVFPDGAHIRHGFFATGMKPDDNLIMPLRHDLHLEQGKNEFVFWTKYFHDIPEYMRLNALQEVIKPNVKLEIMDVVKQIARNYYKEYNSR